jgi:hypothetical protein
MGVEKRVGKVEMLGNSKTDGMFTHYSLIEMGDGSIINGARVGNKLTNFLGKILHSDSEATLWMNGETMVAITSDGKTYVDMSHYQNTAICYLWLVLSIPLCAILIGFFLLIASIKGLSHNSAINDVLDAHPDAIRL